MSLLNDALRDLERRNGNDAAPREAIPAGLRAGPPPRRKAAAIVAIGGVVLGLAAAGTYLGVNTLRIPDPVVAAQADIGSRSLEREPSAANKAPIGDLPEHESVRPMVAPIESDIPGPVLAETNPVQKTPAATATPGTAGEVALESTPEKALPKPLKVAGAGKTGAETGPDSMASAQPNSGTVAERQVPPATGPALENPVEPTPEATVAEAETAAAAAETTETADSEPVKQLPQTAQARDQRLAPTLERLLIEGRESEAERLLEAALATGADMPQSHAALARYYLAQKRIEAARRWLPPALVAREPQLRLLQGRLTLLEQGPEAALAVLAERAPGPAESPEYASTLAALYQQTGQYALAGKQWVALLELDGRRPDWWLGLALALDGQDQASGALTAYRQALELPNLAPRLRAFAQARLDALTLN